MPDEYNFQIEREGDADEEEFEGVFEDAAEGVAEGDYETDEGDEEVTDLVLIVHGIGQNVSRQLSANPYMTSGSSRRSMKR